MEGGGYTVKFLGTQVKNRMGKHNILQVNLSTGAEISLAESSTVAIPAATPAATPANTERIQGNLSEEAA